MLLFIQLSYSCNLNHSSNKSSCSFKQNEKEGLYVSKRLGLVGFGGFGFGLFCLVWVF